MSKDISKEWDYRIVRQTTEDGGEWLSVQEVYYDDETGKPIAHTTDLEVVGDNIEEKLREVPTFKDEDIMLVSQQASVSKEVAIQALTDSQGDLAKAILTLTTK